MTFEQSIERLFTAAATCWYAENDGLRTPSVYIKPDCQPTSRRSSISSKLKNALTAGWQYASEIAAASCDACDFAPTAGKTVESFSRPV